MRLSLAANFDHQLLPALQNTAVKEVFGKLRSDPVGGGRSSYMLASTTRMRLQEYVRLCHWYGIEFNYLINAACLNNREFTRKGQAEIRGLLDWLSVVGVDWVTVSVPFLLEIVKSRYPHFKVKVGVFAEISSPSSAKQWESLGADRITLPPIVVNRDFGRLKAIRDSVECDLELLVNHTCLFDCPFREYHKLLLSHSSQHGNPGAFLIDYCLLKCTTLRIADPSHYIKSPWIRPEDIHLYESIGINSFKVLERGAPSDVLAFRARAYSNRTYHGNLLDIIQPYGFRQAASKTEPRLPWLWDIKQFGRPWKASTTGLLRWREFARHQGMMYVRSFDNQPVYIDNQALDGFLANFPAGGCSLKDCSRCGYCSEYAKKAVTIDPDFQEQSLKLAAENRSNMVEGKLWDRF